jgi:integral membrane protein
MKAPVNHEFLRRLRTMGRIEGVSTLVLFGIAMPMKYAAGIPMAVTIVGSVHGFLFVALSAMFVLGTRRVPLPTSIAFKGIVAAIVPFGPFIMDRTLHRLLSPLPSQGDVCVTANLHDRR